MASSRSGEPSQQRAGVEATLPTNRQQQVLRGSTSDTTVNNNHGNGIKGSGDNRGTSKVLKTLKHAERVASSAALVRRAEDGGGGAGNTPVATGSKVNVGERHRGGLDTSRTQRYAIVLTV